MKAKERKIVLVLAVTFAVLQGFSGTYTWRGGSGNWSDPTKWSGGAENGYPGNSADDVALIPVNTSAITITVDVDASFARLYFAEDSSDLSKTVYLTGSRSLTMTENTATVRGAGFGIDSNRKCVIATTIAPRAMLLNVCQVTLEDGANVSHNSLYVYGRSTMTVNGGNILSGSSSCSMAIRGGGTFIQNGGYVYTRLNLYGASSGYGMGTFVQNGGVFHNRYRDAGTIDDDGAFTRNGGTFRQDGVWTTNCIDWASRLYPVKKGTVTDILYYSGSGNYTKFFDPFGIENRDYATEDESLPPAFTNDYPFAGTLMCTNSTSTQGYPYFVLKSAKATIGRPGGVLVCNSVSLNGATSEVDFRLSKIVLKDTFNINNDGMQVNFPNGIEFGAFGGGWSMTARDVSIAGPAAVNLYGECTIDTTDYLDGVTGRNIKLYNVQPGRNRTSLTVKGAGAATVSLATGSNLSGYDSFRRLEVQSGASLSLDRYSRLSPTFRTVLANELVLGDGAKLYMNVARVPIDAVRTRIGTGAKIYVSVFASMGAVHKRLIGSFGDVEGTLDESSFVIDNQGSVEWQILRSGNTFYLSAVGSEAKPPTSRPSGRGYWTGAAGNGLWSDSDNWLGGYVPNNPSYNSEYSDFYDAYDWSVVNDVKDKLEVRLLQFYSADTKKEAEDSGPYILSGKSILIRAGNSVYNSGAARFPVIISNMLYRLSSSAQFFNASSSDDNSVTLAGGLSVPGSGNSYISLNGDWRLGGTVTGKALVNATRSSGRFNRFSILEGASVTLSSQGTYTNNAMAVRYNIESDGQLKFTGGTSLDFPAGLEEAHHTIYGTLDVGIPLKFGVDQHFHGTGEVKVSSVDDFAGTKARVHLSGGVTLKPAAWATATAADDGVTAITVDGVATIAPKADMTYGAADAGVTSTPEERALEIADAGELTLVANEGRTVTFSDPISGEGKLIISGSGTVSLLGGVTVGELAVSGSPKLKVSGDNPVVASNALSIEGVGLDVVDTTGFASWRTVLSAPEITGTPTLPPNFRARVEIVDGHAELRLKELRGLVITVQ